MQMLLLSACCVQARPCWLVASPASLRTGALGSPAGAGQGEAWCGQVRVVTSSLHFGVSGPPTEKPRGGVAAEDAIVRGLRCVLLCPCHHLLALPGSRVRGTHHAAQQPGAQPAPGGWCPSSGHVSAGRGCSGRPLGLWASHGTPTSALR